MTVYCYDCEFLEDGSTIDLISIGIVASDGFEYYAVNADANWGRVYSHPWLLKNVVSSLPQTISIVDGEELSVVNIAHPDVKSHSVIAEEVRKFLLEGSGKPELWAYYGAYDHVALAQLYGAMIDLPQGIPMFTHELMQLIEPLEARGYVPPRQDETVAHNALEDARWNMHVLRAARAFQQGVRPWAQTGG